VYFGISDYAKNDVFFENPHSRIGYGSMLEGISALFSAPRMKTTSGEQE
jgi:hypothetical protein